jgi:hypothetical protein
MKTTMAGGNRSAPLKKVGPDSQDLANTKTAVACNLDRGPRMRYAVDCGFVRIVFSIQTQGRDPAMSGGRYSLGIGNGE